MNKRSRIWAILGAGVLTLGVVTIALAIELKEEHRGLTVTWDSDGNPVLPDGFENSDACDAPDQGEVIFHFVQSGQDTDVNGTNVNDNTIDVDFDDEPDANDVPADSIQNDQNVDWFVSVDASDGSVTLVTANSNVAGGEKDLRISHICVGEAPEVEATPTFEGSQEGQTDAPTDTPTGTPIVTAPPTLAPTPTFGGSQEGETEAPTNPDTSAIDTGGPASPADSAWLLVVALGVLLASVVVLTPARAKSRR
jgi:hypothetical protein